VTRPAFAVVGRGEEAVNHLFVGVGGTVVEEGRDFFWRGRQADEVEGKAADEGTAVGGWIGLEARLQPFYLKKRVDASRGGRLAYGLQRPEAVGRCAGLRFGPRETGVDPLAKTVDLFRREFLCGRHLKLRMPMLHRLHQETFRRFAGENGGAGLATAQYRFARVKAQAAKGGLGVAGKTMVGENGPDALLKEIVGGSRPSG
jgi:hypothetical protein